LEEIAPRPKHLLDEETQADWVKHMRTGLLHRRIFDEPSVNRDFILSLDPDIAYLVSQLGQLSTRRTTCSSSGTSMSFNSAGSSLDRTKSGTNRRSPLFRTSGKRFLRKITVHPKRWKTRDDTS
jgi:hypothetical protein